MYSRKSPVDAQLGWANLFSIVYCVLSWNARGAHLHPMHFPKYAPHAMFATAQDAQIWNRAIVH